MPTRESAGCLTAVVSQRAECRSPILRRSALRKVGAVRVVSEPIWDWSLRAIRAGEQIDSCHDSDLSDSSSRRLPLLVPGTPGPEADWLRDHLTKEAVRELNPAVRRSSVEARNWRRARDSIYGTIFSAKATSSRRASKGKGKINWATTGTRLCTAANPIIPTPSIGSGESGISRPTANCDKWPTPFWRIQRRPMHRSGALASLHAGPKWDPFCFVDLCEACAADETTELAWAARRIQYVEMSLLMNGSAAPPR